MRQVVCNVAVMACLLGHLAAAAGAEPAVSAWALVIAGTPVTYASAEQEPRIASARRAGEPFFWFAQGGRDYVIRDRAALAAIHAVLAGPGEAQPTPVALDARQAEFRAAHAQVWSAYDGLAAAMNPLGARERDLTVRRAGHLTDRQRTFWTREVDARDADFEARDRAFDDQMEQIGREINALADRTAGIEAGHRGLADQVVAWDRERRAALHAAAVAAANAGAQLQPLLDQALASGAALPLK